MFEMVLLRKQNYSNRDVGDRAITRAARLTQLSTGATWARVSKICEFRNQLIRHGKSWQ